MKQPLRARWILAWVLFSLFGAGSCTATPTPRPLVHLDLVGSDSMQWMARALANAYASEHPDVAITIRAANSQAGLSAASIYSRTIGMVSRTLTPNELNETKAVVIARDGVAVIVNQKNPINAIQRAQIAQVFSGEILTWPAGPSAGKDIVVVSREEGSGTRDAFETMVMNKQKVTRTAVVMPGEAAVVDYVGQHPESIGYVSMGAVTPEVHSLAVDGIQLSVQTVENQKYPLIRTLAFICLLQPDPDTLAFIDFALSTEGQNIIGQKYGRAP